MKQLIAVAAVFSIALPTTLFGHGEPFTYVRGSQTEAKGELELEQWTTARFGKESGDYLGMDFNTELEYGVTDRFQVAGYLNYNYHHLNDAVGSSLDDLFAKQERGVGNFQQTTIGGLRNVLSNAMRGTDLASMQASGVSDLGRQQRVQDPQLATTNKYLQQIAKNTENQAAVAA